MQKLQKKRHPFFKKNSLVFVDSGHSLRKSDRHYRCDLDCKGLCGLKEPQIKTQELEDAFKYLAKTFQVENTYVNKLRRKLVKNFVCEVIFADMDEKDQHQEILDETLKAAISEVNEGSQLQKEDIEEIQNRMVEMQKLDYPILLFGFLIGFIVSASEGETATTTARNLALLAKQIKISTGKKVVAIEFEEWGWFILNYIDQHSPGYLDHIKQAVKIENSAVPNIDLGEALKKYGKDNFNDALNDFNAEVMYTVFKMVKDSISALSDGDSSYMRLTTLEMMKTFSQLPEAELGIKLKSFIKTRP